MKSKRTNKQTTKLTYELSVREEKFSFSLENKMANAKTKSVFKQKGLVKILNVNVL